MKKLLMGAVVMTSLLIASCNSADKGDPKSVLTSFFAALAKKDISAARKLATDESKSMLDMMEMASKMGDKKDDGKYDNSKLEIGDAKIEGDKATIPVKEKASGETTNYTLKKVGDSWKVAFDKSSMMNMGMDKMKDKGMDISDSTIDKGLEKLKDINVDSISNKMKEGLEEAAKKLNDH